MLKLKRFSIRLNIYACSCKSENDPEGNNIILQSVSVQ